MESVTAVYDGYRRELEETAQGLRQRGLQFQEQAPNLLASVQAQIEPQKQELVATVTDTQSEISTPATAVLQTFGWASVLLFASSLASIAGGYILAPFIGLLVGKLGAGLIASFAIPAYAYFSLKQAQAANQSDNDIRFQLLGFAVAQGLLLGFAISTSYAGQPVAFLTPAVISIAFPFVLQSAGSNRTTVLGATLGAAFLANFVVGFITGSLSFSFLFLETLYIASSAAVLQFLFKEVKTAEAPVHIYQLAVLSAFVLSKAFTFGLLGSSQPSAPAEQPAPAQK